jgi:DNA repair photolyase
MEQLAAAGVPVSVLVAPVIPALNDDEIERVLEAAANAGAGDAAYIFLRLPHEVRDIFKDWLHTHFPDRAARVMGLVREASGGRDYDNRFGIRQTGRGPYADLLGKRFRAACRRFGLEADRQETALDCSRFDPPGQQQLGLF